MPLPKPINPACIKKEERDDPDDHGVDSATDGAEDSIWNNQDQKIGLQNEVQGRNNFKHIEMPFPEPINPACIKKEHRDDPDENGVDSTTDGGADSIWNNQDQKIGLHNDVQAPNNFNQIELMYIVYEFDRDVPESGYAAVTVPFKAHASVSKTVYMESGAHGSRGNDGAEQPTRLNRKRKAEPMHLMGEVLK
uniref:PITH domain-containing protein n=1 Tax=Steinernema glaseri TaxID=37863 RepID=A0A1I8AVT2_9BILA